MADLDSDFVSSIDEMLERIKNFKDVLGYVISTSDGAIAKTSFSEEATASHYTELAREAVKRGSSPLHEIDPSDDFVFLRLRTKKKEIFIAPEKDLFMIVVQSIKK